jgi:hypothetical protein
VPEIIDPVFVKTSPKRSFSMTEYERFGLVFTNTRVYKFGHWTTFKTFEAPKAYSALSLNVKSFNKNFSPETVSEKCWDTI